MASRLGTPSYFSVSIEGEPALYSRRRCRPPANTQNEYVFFGGKRVAVVPASGSSLFYAEDLLGSSRVIVQSNGTLCYDADFTPFGAERAYTSTCPQNYKFEGKERDSETQNDEFGARSYSWRFGRWLSSDWSAVPVAVPYANLTNPQTLNLYAMVADDPESFADLDGHQDAANTFDYERGDPKKKDKDNDKDPPPPPPAQTTPPPPPPAPPKKGFGILPTGTGAVDLGVGKAGVTAQGSVAPIGGFVDNKGHPHVGAEASGSLDAYAGQHTAATPKQDKDSFVVGAFAGVGVGVTLTNAGNAPAMKSMTNTLNIDLGLGPAASISISSGHSGVSSVTITLGWGCCAAVTETNTGTATLPSQ
ncbi:MAG: hypothetical protein LAO30_15150 [Acidobacteriia bacterium]|nr:hypothetical protein [Terriglobia bacterium]